MGLWQFFGFAFVSLLGTLLHFLYEWTGNRAIVALVSGVNESTWEHMKLLYFPLLVFALLQRRFWGEREDFWCVKLRGTLYGLVLIPVLFYTLNGAFGKTPDFLNISIFFVSAGAVFLWETRRFKKENPCRFSFLALWLLLAIGVLFVVFTFVSPKIPLFEDPLTGMYGV